MCPTAFTAYIHACILVKIPAELQQEFWHPLQPIIDHAAWRPRYNPWLVAFIVTLATFMEVLDTSIANIALPHIAGSFGASTNESTWVLTSYLVSNGIVLPISAWLATRFGRKRYYMFCVVLFAGSSFLCGLAPTLGMLVFFRVLQGVGGGGLQPSEQSILADTFTPAATGHGIFDLCDGGGAGAGDRSDAGRMDHRQLTAGAGFSISMCPSALFRSI